MMWWIRDREYPVDEHGVCCLCDGTGTVAHCETFCEEERGMIEYPIMCVCIADWRWSLTSVDEMLETNFYGVE